MCMCTKCGKSLGWLVLIIGLLLLLKNVGVWTFWGIDAWTIVFILAGFAMIGKSCCKDCGTSCCVDSTPKKVAKPKKK